jgi:transcriptional regulator GlxA family with amidase domain
MLTTSSHRDGTLERREAILRDALESILRDHGPHSDLEAVARRIGTSRRQLQRVFAELSDRSFRDTIAAVRMAHARKLLTETDRPIAEIGRVAGYHQAAQFSKAFRHHHGTSPRLYRQRARRVTVSLNGDARPLASVDGGS